MDALVDVNGDDELFTVQCVIKKLNHRHAFIQEGDLIKKQLSDYKVDHFQSLMSKVIQYVGNYEAVNFHRDQEAKSGVLQIQFFSDL